MRETAAIAFFGFKAWRFVNHFSVPLPQVWRTHNIYRLSFPPDNMESTAPTCLGEFQSTVCIWSCHLHLALRRELAGWKDSSGAFVCRDAWKSRKVRRNTSITQPLGPFSHRNSWDPVDG